MSDLTVQAGDGSITLLPERAILLPASGTLVVADVHWGKAASFRAASIPIPRGTTSNDLQRLSSAIRRTGAVHLVILGDLLHARTWTASETRSAIYRWREEHGDLPMTLVRGNHDLRAGDPPRDLHIECCNQPHALETFHLCHTPCAHEGGYTLAGHVHPCFTLYGSGRQRERLPCFHLGPRIGLLPAFGSFTGMAPIDLAPGDAVFVIAGEEIVEVEN